ncbi:MULTISPECIES: thiamine-binding protein [Cohnella]|uniref:thiamine-binding protein n=1 Tax=Cohnella TaxID=329857 RepID=UPI0009BA0D66|nr:MULTISPECIES: thiamine-binding protein [Cohnella]MBN2983510.1 thiamine-binding protein [Cohnella algarum]
MAQALLSIQILPRTKSGDDSVYPYVDKAIDIIKASGVPYRVGPLETTMEGDLDLLLDIVKQMNAAMFELGSPSVLSQIKLSVDRDSNASMARLLQNYPDGK